MPIDILAGSDRLRQAIEADVPAHDIAAEWEAGTVEFREGRRPYLIY
jgi:hypothetical protein